MTDTSLMSIDPDKARALWTQAMAEVASVITIDDGLERNRRITKAYAEMYLRRPELLWVGAAAFVSKDIGGELSKLGSMSVWGALSLGNKTVFEDLYRYFRYYELIKAHQGNGSISGYTKFIPDDTHPDVVTALEMLPYPEQAHEANMRLLDYEQAVTVQQKVYDSPWFWRNLDVTRLTNYKLAAVDVSFTRYLPENAPPDTCVIFTPDQGDLYIYNDRIKFSCALMDKFCTMISTETGRKNIETELQALVDLEGETPGWRTTIQDLAQTFEDRACQTLEQPIPAWGNYRNLI